VVRTLFMPSLATMLGRWFWWPQVVHPRGDHAKPKPKPASVEDDNTAPLAVQKS
jgi:RND superfamily putative drug exporter